MKFNAKGGSFYKDGPNDYFAARMTSNFEAKEAGEYTFYLTSDDGSKLIIDEEPVIDNDGLHSSKKETVTIELEEGMHELELLYFENTGNASVDLDWSGPDFGKKQMKFEAAEEPEAIVLVDQYGFDEDGCGQHGGDRADWWLLDAAAAQETSL